MTHQHTPSAAAVADAIGEAAAEYDDRPSHDEEMFAVDPERSAYIAGLRQLADILEAEPDLPLPSDGTDDPLRIWFHGGPGYSPVQERFAAGTRALKRHVRRPLDKGVNGGWFDIRTTLGGLRLELTSKRDDVCERVVVGTERVTEKVKDPELLAQIPEVEVTEERPVYEWRCAPLLADESGGGA